MPPKKSSSKINFDSETGAVERDIIPFGSSKGSKRGFGKSAAFDDHPFLKPQISLIIGSTGSGKSVLALNILQEIVDAADHKRLGKIMVYSGSGNDPALQSLDDDIVDLYTGEQEITLIDDLTALDGAMKMIDEIQRPFNVLILDDTGGSKLLAPTNLKGSIIGQTLISHRHLNLHVIILGQRVKGMISPFILANMSQLFLFRSKNKNDLDELIRNVPFPPEPIHKAMASINSRPHDFIRIDLMHRSVFKGMNELILS
jgi:hypothetical protein